MAKKTKNDDPVMMEYRKRDTPEETECVYTYHGKEYVFKYAYILTLAKLFDVPDRVREDILFWAKMLNDPD